MKKDRTYRILVTLIFSVWLINGLFCKILNIVPRNQEIVASILGTNYAGTLTTLIGIMEVFLALWILSDRKVILHANIQIGIVFIMNVLEFFLVPDLLLWGKFNIIFAFAFISLVHYTYFIHKKSYVRIS